MAETVQPASTTAPPPDVSPAAQPGAAAMTPAPAAAVAPDNSAAGVQAQMAPFQAKEQQAAQNASDLTKPDAPAAPVPHARLLSMIQGLSLGLSAAATSIGSHGQEGGAKEVIQVQQAQKEADQRAKEAALQQKSTKIQQQLMVADTNQKLANNVLLMAQFRNGMSKADLEQSGEKQRQSVVGADFAASHGGMSPDDFNKALSGTTPAGSPGASSFFTENAKQQLGAATKVLGADDPYVKQMQDTLANPNATPKDLWQSTSRLQTQVGLQEKATDAQVKKDTLAKDELQQGQARVANSVWLKQVPKDKNGNPTQDFETWQKTRQKELEHAVQTGDLDSAGKLLASGLTTLADLKARGTTEGDIITAIKHAQKYEPNYNPSDEIVGEQVMKIPATQTFFGSARSMVQPGGMLDQLKSAHDKLGNGKIPVFNKYSDLLAYQGGDNALANYKTALLGAADDYAKVIGGGNVSDSAREAAAEQFLFQLNQGQFDNSVETSRNAVKSQVEGRIGTNRYMHQREGDILGATVTDPRGTVHHFPDQASADKFKKLAGIN